MGGGWGRTCLAMLFIKRGNTEGLAEGCMGKVNILNCLLYVSPEQDAHEAELLMEAREKDNFQTSK